jgi:quinoprotein glucose dehydrogenase
MAFLPDGRILVTERPGRVRVVFPGEGLRSDPWATLAVQANAEAGLLGIDLAPDFHSSGEVFLLGTFQDASQGRLARLISSLQRRIAARSDPDAGTSWVNRVIRLRESDGVGVDPLVVVDGLPSGPVHAGGAIRFGPDGLLYLTLGDGTESVRASQWSSLRGKILRFERSGDPARENPSPGSPVFAVGLRNPQGLAWDPESGMLLAPDHGPTGMPHELGRSDHDELNQIVAGGNYGWDEVAGMWSGEGIMTPLAEWTPAIAPGGIAILDDPTSLWHGDVFLTGLVSQQVVRVVLTPADGASGSHSATCTESLLRDDYGRLRGIRTGPDGTLYFTTSNRDQRGSPRPSDDLLLRIVPPRVAP